MTTTKTGYTYSELVAQVIKAGFEYYSNTVKDGYPNRDIDGAIFTNTKKDSPYNGEVVDIFEDGTYEVYTQFKDQPKTFKFD